VSVALEFGQAALGGTSVSWGDIYLGAEAAKIGEGVRNGTIG